MFQWAQQHLKKSDKICYCFNSFCLKKSISDHELMADQQDRWLLRADLPAPLEAITRKGKRSKRKTKENIL